MKRVFLIYPSRARVIEARREASLTQAEAAALVRASPTTWRHWESGVRKMPLASFETFMRKTKQPFTVEF